MPIPRSLACVLLAAAAALSVFSGCAVGGQPIEKAVMCSAVSPNGEPKTITTSFAPDVKTIYCSVKLSSVSAKSNVKAEWYLVKSDEPGVNGDLIGLGTVIAGTQYVVLAFTRSDKLLPRGDYEVKLYYDSKLVQSAPFTVKGEASASAATLSDATMCSSLDLFTNRPIDVVDTFASDITNVYCSAKVNNADFNTNLRARWTYLGGAVESLKGQTIPSQPVKAEGREYVSFSVGMPPGKRLPVGDYSVTLFVEDKEQASLPFKVVEAASLKWPYVTEASTFKLSGTDNKSITVTQDFSSDVPEIDLMAKAYNAPAATELTVQWVIARSADSTLLDQQIKEDKIKIEGTGPIIIGLVRRSEPFIKGYYLANLLLDGKKLAAVPFRVE
jgi:hypothetical protein